MDMEEQQAHQSLPKEWKTSKDFPLDNVTGDISKGTKEDISHMSCYGL